MKSTSLSFVFFIIVLLALSCGPGTGVGVSIDVERVEASAGGHQLPGGIPFVYVAKYVCGTAGPDTTTVVVLPGDYATKINVVNVAGVNARFFKKIFVLRGGQEPTDPQVRIDDEALAPNQAMEITCEDIAKHLNRTLPGPFFEGFVEIATLGAAIVTPTPGGELFTDPLEVWAVYMYRDEVSQ